jgi:aminoglycoside 6'-N-acetyltransferase
MSSPDAAGRTPAPAELVGRSVALVPVAPEHVEPLLAILREPAVARWWPDHGDWAREHVLEPDPDVTGFAVLELPSRAVIGYLQAVEETEPDFRNAGIDLFLAIDRHGRGLGPDAIRTAIRWLVEAGGHHRITIDPEATNVAAIRAYAKVGFRRVGILRRYTRHRDGTWHDGLLMDLLADELVEG